MQIVNVGTVQQNKVLQQKGFYASKAFSKGDTILLFGAREMLTTPNYLTVQTGERTHILLSPIAIQYVNHSCMPNVFFNTNTFQLEALQDIAIGDELTFFYPSTEWKMEQPFSCTCGKPNCLQSIQGAFFLTEEEISTYKFTDFIQQKLKASKIAIRA